MRSQRSCHRLGMVAGVAGHIDTVDFRPPQQLLEIVGEMDDGVALGEVEGEGLAWPCLKSGAIPTATCLSPGGGIGDPLGGVGCAVGFATAFVGEPACAVTGWLGLAFASGVTDPF